jgi:hypothetical protein
LNISRLIVVLFVVLWLRVPVSAITINVSFSGGNAPGSAVGGGVAADLVREAADVWEAAFPTFAIVNLEWRWADTTGAGATIEQTDGNIFNRPSQTEIRFGNQTDWFFDPTPRVGEEWSQIVTTDTDLGAGPVNVGRQFTGYTGPTANGNLPWDFFTIALHEMGHALGLATNYDGYDQAVDNNGNITIGDNIFNSPTTFDGSVVPTTTTGGAHLDLDTSLMWIDPINLFQPGMADVERRLPSAIDILAISEAGTWLATNTQPIQPVIPEPTTLALLIPLFASLLPRRRTSD